MILSLLIKFGLSEASAIAFAGCKWCKRVIATFAAAAVLLAGGWYLTHLGGEWREAAIRRAWTLKFATVANETRRLSIARQRAALDVERAVQEAIDALPVPVAAEPAPFTTVTVTKCELPAAAVRKLNRIR